MKLIFGFAASMQRAGDLDFARLLSRSMARAMVNLAAVAVASHRRHSWSHANAAVCRDNIRPVFGSSNHQAAVPSAAPKGKDGPDSVFHGSAISCRMTWPER
jgi:hypothetical protein